MSAGIYALWNYFVHFTGGASAADNVYSLMAFQPRDARFYSLRGGGLGRA